MKWISCFIGLSLDKTWLALAHIPTCSLFPHVPLSNFTFTFHTSHIRSPDLTCQFAAFDNLRAVFFTQCFQTTYYIHCHSEWAHLFFFCNMVNELGFVKIHLSVSFNQHPKKKWHSKYWRMFRQRGESLIISSTQFMFRPKWTKVELEAVTKDFWLSFFMQLNPSEVVKLLLLKIRFRQVP